MKRTLLLLLCLSLPLSACAVKTSPDSGGSISVYRIISPEFQTSGELLQAVELPLAEGADPVAAAVEALAAEPMNDRLESPLSSNLRIVSAERSGSSVIIELNPSYYLLTGMDKTTLDSCLCLTMCSINGVERVVTRIGNEVIEENLRASDILLENTVKTSSEAKVRLYYPSNLRLRYEYRSLSLEGEGSIERSVVEELLSGPRSAELYPALPEGTVLLTVYTQDGVCTVSLSEDLAAACDEQPDNAPLWVYSVVNSLCSLSSVNSVKIIIEGASVQSLGSCDVSVPLTKNEKLTGSPVF